MTEEKRNKGLIFQFIMLMLLLAVTPIGTYFWMKEGVDYRAKRLAELEDFGRIGNFESINAKGTAFDTTDTAGKMILVTLLEGDDAAVKKRVERIELVENQMEEQLDQRKDMLFLFYTTKSDLENYSKNLLVKENDKFVFVTVSDAEMNRIKKDVFYFENAKKIGVEIENPLALVDLKGKIRHYYDPFKNDDMGKLVEHMAMILPQDKDKDIVFRRESEK